VRSVALSREASPARAVNVDAALPDPECGLEASMTRVPLRRTNTQPVLHDFKLALVFAQIARVALVFEQRAYFGFRKILRHRYRKSDDQPGVACGAGARDDLGVYRLRRVTGYFPSAAAAGRAAPRARTKASGGR